MNWYLRVSCLACSFFFLFHVVFVSTSFATSNLPPGSDRLDRGEVLRNGEYIISPNNEYFAIMQGDGNFVIYEGTPENRGNARWASGSADAIGDYFAIMRGDGNFVVNRGTPQDNRGVHWSTGVNWSIGDYILRLGNDGHLSVSGSPFQNGSSLLWSSRTHLSTLRVLRTGQYISTLNNEYFAVMQGDGNFVIYEGTPENRGNAKWASGSADTIGDYFAVVQGDGNFVVYKGTPENNQGAHWNSGILGPIGSYIAELRNDGKLVVYRGENIADDSNFIWGTQTLLATGEILFPNQRLTSPDGHYRIQLSEFGRIYVEKKAPNSGWSLIWISDIPAAERQDYFAIMQNDGNFVVYRGTPENNKGLHWDSGVNGPIGDYFAIMQNDGNFAVYSGKGPANNTGYVWGSGEPRIGRIMFRDLTQDNENYIHSAFTGYDILVEVQGVGDVDASSISVEVNGYDMTRVSEKIWKLHYPDPGMSCPHNMVLEYKVTWRSNESTVPGGDLITSQDVFRRRLRVKGESIRPRFAGSASLRFKDAFRIPPSSDPNGILVEIISYGDFELRNLQILCNSSNGPVECSNEENWSVTNVPELPNALSCGNIFNISIKCKEDSEGILVFGNSGLFNDEFVHLWCRYPQGG